jgi:hypothetical protein
MSRCQHCKKQKDFIEFLELLCEITKLNIDYIKLKKENPTPALYWKYSKEILQIQYLINSFDMVY